MDATKHKSIWNSIISLGSTVIKKTKYGTAMDSILTVTALVSLPCIVVYAYTRFWPILLVACAPVFLFIRAYEYFMKNNPKMLRTEKHEETLLRIASKMGQKGKEVTEEVLDALPAVSAHEASSKVKAELIAPSHKKGKNA